MAAHSFALSGSLWSACSNIAGDPAVVSQQWQIRKEALGSFVSVRPERDPQLCLNWGPCEASMSSCISLQSCRRAPLLSGCGAVSSTLCTCAVSPNSCLLMTTSSLLLTLPVPTAVCVPACSERSSIVLLLDTCYRRGVKLKTCDLIPQAAN